MHNFSLIQWNASSMTNVIKIMKKFLSFSFNEKELLKNINIYYLLIFFNNSFSMIENVKIFIKGNISKKVWTFVEHFLKNKFDEKIFTKLKIFTKENLAVKYIFFFLKN